MPTDTVAPAANAPAAPSLPEPVASRDEIALLPADLQRKLAGWYRRQGRFADAEAALDEIEARAGRTAGLLEERAALALARRDAEGVGALWAERLERSAPVTARVAFARALIELGDLAAAADTIAGIAGEQEADALAADLALLAGDPLPARARAERNLADNAALFWPRLALARIAAMTGEPAEARSHLDRLLADHPQPAAAQAAAAASVADLLHQPERAAGLRAVAAREDALKTSALAADIDDALGREPGSVPAVEPPAGTPADRRSPTLPEPTAVAHVHVAAAPEPPTEPGPDTDDADADAPAGEELPEDPRVLGALRDLWGHDQLRRGQAAVINRVMAGRDTLAIMPTGAGKSLTFQLPAMLLDGVTLVISPLIALMKDQVEGLPPAVRERTALLNSTISPEAQRALIDEIRDGRFSLVYVAPERLRHHAFLRALREAGVARVVVDEAHCISLWGHDFRPDYLTIPAALPELGDPPVLALTATATREIERGIEARFGRDLDVLRTGVFRPNLRYEVEILPDRKAKLDRMLAICKEAPGAGIVYVSSRKDTETFADLLRRERVPAIPYHAGLDPDTRARNQERFMSGEARVVVATVAFGMGVDKSDVRFIVHASPPGSLEAYAQESGRAGRDGQPARCVMLATPRDRTALNRMAKRDALGIEDLRRAYAGVKRAATGNWALLDPSSLSIGAADADPDDAPDPRLALNLLEEGELLRRHPDAPTFWTLRRGDAPDAEGQPAPLLAALLEWAGPGGGRIPTAEACAELGCTPQELAAALLDAPGWRATEGPRLACYELLPADAGPGRPSAAERLNAVMLAAARRAQLRIARVIDYQAGRQCRHVLLARHLGERLAPCGEACDVCDPSGEEAAPVATRQRAKSRPEDALAVIEAVRSLPHPVGKNRLVHFLSGSAESRIPAGRSRWYGALADLRKARIEALIDNLLAAEALAIDPDDEYRVIHAAPGSDRLTPADLAPCADAPAASLDAAGQELVDRLAAWRRQRAARDGVPAYTVASNASLEDIAWRRPADEEALARIAGFGAARAARYAAEMLPIIRGEG